MNPTLSRGRRARRNAQRGRFKNEGTWVQEAKDGRVVVYMGDISGAIFVELGDIERAIVERIDTLLA